MRIGIDLGGTKTEVVALNDQGEILLRERKPSAQGDFNATVERIAELVEHAEQTLGESGTVGVGIPGTISPLTGKVKNANSTWLNGQDLKGVLEQRLGREVRIANDANCMAVSEAVDGAGAGAKTVFAVILGTGSGAGIAIDGQVHSGGNGVGGEWGHNPLPWLTDEEWPQRVDCYCGQKGCVETYISGSGFARQYQMLSGQALSGREIMALVRDGDELAGKVLEQYRDQLARVLANVVNILDPDMIVLAGGMSNVDEIYDGLAERMQAYVFGGEFSTPIRKAEHGDSSGVRGAAWLWPADA